MPGGRPRGRGVRHRNITAVRNTNALNNAVGYARRRQNRVPVIVQFPFRRELENELSIEVSSCGTLSLTCQHCSALHFRGEAIIASNGIIHYNSCCHNGLVFFPQTRVHLLLKDLFLNNSQFMDNIRKYNSAVAFASFSATRAHIPGSGPQCFKVQGAVHRYISDLLPTNANATKFGQLYIIDTQEANEIRINRNTHFTNATLNILTDILRDNPYTIAYKMAKNVMAEETSQQRYREVELRFIDYVVPNNRYRLNNNDPSRHRYHRPTANEIAGIFFAEDGAPPTHRYIVAHGRQSGAKLMHYFSPHCDPMIYPLLFPYGESGWDYQLTHNGVRRQRERESLTMLQFIAFRLAIRCSFSHIHQSGKLFQQYLVDCYTRIEGQRLQFLSNNQRQLRVEQYCGLHDYVNLNADERGLVAGRVSILPSTFIGSPRNMLQNYQDAMSIVRKFGKPDLFITFTCNPKWPEITSSLLENEKIENRPDIVSRVFKLKLDAMKHDLITNKVFGDVIAYVYVIEFQKRGLQHAHILLILEESARIHEPSDIDLIVSAELPNPTEFPRLYSIVTSKMIHGPCGERNPSSPCMINGKCSKNYPKNFLDVTQENNNGYPLYRRRNNGITSRKGVHLVNNRDVVPYNKFLLLKYDAHINVEVCSSVKSVKYLFKYVYKGYDAANIAFYERINGDLDFNEILSYSNARYISAHECVWRIHENEMHKQSHKIFRLAIHLEDHQQITFLAGREVEALDSIKDTTLLAWFKLNSSSIASRRYLYSEIPNYYTFKNNAWQVRQRGFDKVIGRIYAVSCHDIERFYLRLLLLHVKGATYFNDLKTVDGTVYLTYREAATHRGLTDDDNEWFICLQELSSISSSHQMRQVFAFICCFCDPSSPIALYNAFKYHFYDNYLQEFNERDAENIALNQISVILRANNKSCASIGLPVPTIVSAPIQFSASQLRQRGEQLYSQLNHEQTIVVDTILSSINGCYNRKIFFLEAPGGSGKTFVYSCLLNIVRGRNLSALAGAFTGIAALLLEEGMTLHKMFGLPLNLNESSVSNVSASSAQARCLRDVTIFVIDEATMIPAHAITVLIVCLGIYYNAMNQWVAKYLYLAEILGKYCLLFRMLAE